MHGSIRMHMSRLRVAADVCRNTMARGKFRQVLCGIEGFLASALVIEVVLKGLSLSFRIDKVAPREARRHHGWVAKVCLGLGSAEELAEVGSGEAIGV